MSLSVRSVAYSNFKEKRKKERKKEKRPKGSKRGEIEKSSLENFQEVGVGAVR